MAVKGIAVFEGMAIENGTLLCLYCKGIGIDDAFAEFPLKVEYTKAAFVLLTLAQVVADIKAAVRARLISDFGFTFEVGDTTIVVGLNVQ